MTISLSGRHRERFIADLRAHRESFSLNDQDYAEQVLKISLNTYKKCTKKNGSKTLALKRHTFLSIFANTSLDPKAYGLGIGVPSQASPYGGYRVQDYPFLCGRFYLYRRSFLTGRHITRSILEVRPSKGRECLSFHETHYYTAEVGVREENHYAGDIYMNRERSVLSLPSFSEGQVRLTLLQPERVGARGRVKMRGALLTFGNPKGYWQPTVSSVFVEGPTEEKRLSAKDLCKMILHSSDEYAPLSQELARVEEHATINASLMWARLQDQASPR